MLGFNIGKTRAYPWHCCLCCCWDCSSSSGKKVSNFLVLMERSAMSDRQKRVSLTQEVIRILRNTKKELPDSVKNDLLSEFSLRMMMSGYSEKFRLEVISSHTPTVSQIRLKKAPPLNL